MEDPSRAVSQFLPDESGGMAGGSVPGGPSGNFPVVFPPIGENGEAPSKSGTDSGSEWRSFEERVLLEPFSPSESSSSHSIHYAVPGADEAAEAQERMLEKERLCALLERHLRKYSYEKTVREEYPQLREADFQHLSNQMASGFLEADSLPASVIKGMAEGALSTYKGSKSSLKGFLEDHYPPY